MDNGLRGADICGGEMDNLRTHATKYFVCLTRSCILALVYPLHSSSSADLDTLSPKTETTERGRRIQHTEIRDVWDWHGMCPLGALSLFPEP